MLALTLLQPWDIRKHFLNMASSSSQLPGKAEEDSSSTDFIRCCEYLARMVPTELDALLEKNIKALEKYEEEAKNILTSPQVCICGIEMIITC